MSNEKSCAVVGGPIELRDYDYLTLAEDHTMVLLDGSTMHVAAGTKLIMNRRGGGPGIRYKGVASKGCAGDYPPEADA